MRHVSMSEFEERHAEIVAAAESGEQVVVTRDGRPAVHLIGVAQPALPTSAVTAAAGFAALRQAQADRGVSTTMEEILAWRDEGRR